MTPSEEQRLFLIADLSGYTGYLVGGEPEEAPLIAGDLVETVVTHLGDDFELAGLEGDAAFVHAPLSQVGGAQVLRVVAACHAAFRRRVQSLSMATTCSCRACRRAPSLELKFFLHVGTATRQRIAGREELAGRDVILVHRLLKDSAAAAAGMTSYALFTDAAVHALGLNPVTVGLRRTVQRYEHFGDVVAWVGPPEQWLAPGPTHPVGEPVADLRAVIPAPPAAVWELLTVPEHRELWEGLERVEEWGVGEQRGVGTLSRCAARRLDTIEELVDWRPPVSFTRLVRDAGDAGGGVVTACYDLEPADEGTLLRVRHYGEESEQAAPIERSLRRLAEVAARWRTAATAPSSAPAAEQHGPP